MSDDQDCFGHYQEEPDLKGTFTEAIPIIKDLEKLRGAFGPFFATLHEVRLLQTPTIKKSTGLLRP